jgi:hypothetical protein
MRGRYCVHSKINIRLYQVRTARGARGEPASGRVRSSSSKAVGAPENHPKVARARPSASWMIADSKPTAGFQRVVQRAVIHVQSAGREEVTGANLLTAIFAEHESHAAYFLEEAKLTRYDVVNYIAHGIRRDEAIERIAESIEESASSAPVFVPVGGRLHYQQTAAVDRIDERKAEVVERHSRLKHLCDLRVNEHPEFRRCSRRIWCRARKANAAHRCVRSVFGRRGGRNVFKDQSDGGADRDRNPPLDADQLFAAQSLIIAHAGLVTLFPDVQIAAAELDRYRQMSEPLDALRDRVLDPIFQQLAQASDIFDEELETASDIETLDNTGTSAGLGVTQGVAAVKHSWVRGALAAIGQYLLRQGREITKTARDATVKESVSQAMKHPDALLASMMSFLSQSKSALLSLADNLHAQFGWIISLLSHLGM